MASSGARILVNPGRVATPPVVAPTDAPRAFHQRLPGYAVTPLVRAPALAAELGVGAVWVKDESSRLGLPSFKILGASWATYCVLVDRLGHQPEWRDLDDLRGALRPLGDLTLVAATDGNHGRAVARVARLLGYAAHILVPAGTADARVDAIAGEGAHVTVVDGTYDDAVIASAELASENVLVVSDTSWTGYVDVPRRVIEGYDTIFAEVDEQLSSSPDKKVDEQLSSSPDKKVDEQLSSSPDKKVDEHLDAVVVPMGVGALTAAVVSHYAAQAAVFAVEPVSAACGQASAAAGRPIEVPGPHPSIMAGLNCGTVSAVAWPAVHAGVDAFVTVDDADAEQAMRDMARIDVTAGETGAAALAGLRALTTSSDRPAAIDLSGRSVLVLCTEGATDPRAYTRIVGTH
jgi:diaminopropionate ammonia-lyase